MTVFHRGFVLPAIIALFVSSQIAATNRLVHAQPANRQAVAPAESERRPYYIPVPLSFEDVDVAKLLSRLEYFGLQLPIAVTGRVSADFQVQLPIGALAQGRAYRIHGLFTSKQLTVAGRPLEQLSANLDYRDGVLQLNSLRFQLPAAAGTQAADAGRFAGSGSLQVAPRGDLTLQLTLDRVEIAQFLEVFPELKGLGTGRISATVSADVPVNDLRNPDAWRSQGQVSLVDVNVSQLPSVAASAAFQLQNGNLSVSNLVGTMKDARVNGRGSVRLQSPFPFQGLAQLAMPDAKLLNAIEPRIEADAGVINLNVSVNGNLDPITWQAAGRFQGQNLTSRNLRLDRLTMDYSSSPERTELNNVLAEAYEGQANGNVALRPDGQIAASFQWRDIAAGALAQAIAPLPFDVQGSTSGSAQLRIPIASLENPATWNATGEALVLSGELAGVTWEELRTQFSLADGDLSISDFRARQEDGTVVMTGSVKVSDPYGFQVSARLSNGRLQWLGKVASQRGIPGQLRGVFNANGVLRGTLQPFAVTGNGGFAGRDIGLDQAGFDQLRFQFSLTPKLLGIRELSAQLYGGTATGSANLPLAADQAGAGSLRWDEVQVNELLSAVTVLPTNVAGKTSGSASLQMPPGSFADARLWTGEGELRAEQVSLFGWQSLNAQGSWRLGDQTLSIVELTASKQNAQVEMTGNLKLDEPFAFTSRVQATNLDLASLNQLPLEIKPPFEIQGKISTTADLQGSLKPLTVNGTGQATGEQLLVDKTAIDSLRLQYAADRDQIKVTDAVARLYGGEATFSGSVPLNDESPGEGNVQWQSVDLGALLQSAFDIPVQAKLEAVADGNLQARFPAGKLNDLQDWTVTASTRIDSISANSFPVGSLNGSFRQQDGDQTITANGAMLRGRFQVERQPSEPGIGSPEITSVVLTGIQINELRHVVPRNRGWSELRGVVNSNLQLHRHDDGEENAHGTLTLLDFGWGGEILAPRLQGRFDGTLDRLFLSDFSGPFAGGQLRFAARIELDNLDASTFNAAFGSVDIADALSIFWPELETLVSGKMDAQLRGSLTSPLTIGGTAAIQSGSVSGLAVRGIRLPLQVRFDPISGRSEIQVSQASGQFGGGRVTGNIDWSSDSRLDGNVKFYNVDLPKLLREFGVSERYGSGIITGELTLGGRRVESLRDITGTLQATLKNAQAMSFPVLQQMRPYLNGATGATTFDDGSIRARLAGGQLDIQQFSLSSSSVQVFIDGTMSLTGQLRLNATASTSQLTSGGPFARLLVNQLPLATPMPIGMLATANRFLADRVIYMQISGSIKNPIIRVLPVPLLRDAAVRFFLEQSVGAGSGS